MINLDIKTQNSSSILDKSSKQESGLVGLSFGELLRGVGKESDLGDTKLVQNGALVLALDEESVTTESTTESRTSSKSDILLNLLKGDASGEKVPSLELNPALTKNLTPVELKILVKDAKNYLREKIIQSEGFKKVEIESLPKTLKGLAQVAKKFAIDVSKITIEEIKVAPKSMTKISLELDTDSDIKSDTVQKKSSQNSSSLDFVESEPLKVIKKNPKLELAAQKNIDSEEGVKESKVDAKVSLSPKELKTTPLFKAQVSAELTTEQIVHTKINRLEVKTPKSKADETLKMLLRGEKSSKQDSSLTTDFSVATARVIAPEITKPKTTSQSLEALLHGDRQENSSSQKIDGLNIPKADSFDLKLHEAKQMTKYLSADVKTAIEDYKSPFTRVKVELNPQRLGSIELTVVQRGKNLHINLSSNNAAVNALAMNAQDLKLQLTNNGINNASLNFNNNSSDSNQSGFGQQQQNSQQGREAKDEYNYFDNEEKNEEILSSLEIVVPNYA